MLQTHCENANSDLIIGLDNDLFGLAENYLKKRKLELSQIRDLVLEGQFSEIEFIGHKLKGNAALFELNELGEMGAELELLALDGQSERILNLAEKMLCYLQRIRFVSN